jgi:hypothetical protein
MWANGVLPKYLDPKTTHVVASLRHNEALKEETIMLLADTEDKFANFEPYLAQLTENGTLIFFATPERQWVRGPEEKVQQLEEHARNVRGLM